MEHLDRNTLALLSLVPLSLFFCSSCLLCIVLVCPVWIWPKFFNNLCSKILNLVRATHRHVHTHHMFRYMYHQHGDDPWSQSVVFSAYLLLLNIHNLTTFIDAASALSTTVSHRFLPAMLKHSIVAVITLVNAYFHNKTFFFLLTFFLECLLWRVCAYKILSMCIHCHCHWGIEEASSALMLYCCKITCSGLLFFWCNNRCFYW